MINGIFYELINVPNYLKESYLLVYHLWNPKHPGTRDNVGKLRR